MEELAEECLKMAFDPYGPSTPEQQLTTGDIGKEILTAPFRPSTYLWPYMNWPGMYTKKGIIAPFETSGKRWRQQFEKTFKYQRGIFGGEYVSRQAVGMDIKKIPGFLKNVGPLGKGHYFGNIETAENRLKRLRDLRGGMIKRRFKLTEKSFRISGKMNNIRDSYVPKNLSNIESTPVKRSARRLKPINEEIMRLNKRIETISEKVVSQGKKVRWLKTAKWAGRGVSTVGLAMFAFDVASMVAKPLAQAAVGALNNLATEYQQRFMPELGGQLQASYISYGAATERQRSIMALSKSSLNGRSAFGSEASMYHQ
jgi:hypothetical protein